MRRPFSLSEWLDGLVRSLSIARISIWMLGRRKERLEVQTTSERRSVRAVENYRQSTGQIGVVDPHWLK